MLPMPMTGVGDRVGSISVWTMVLTKGRWSGRGALSALLVTVFSTFGTVVSRTSGGLVMGSTGW